MHYLSKPQEPNSSCLVMSNRISLHRISRSTLSLSGQRSRWRHSSLRLFHPDPQRAGSTQHKRTFFLLVSDLYMFFFVDYFSPRRRVGSVAGIWETTTATNDPTPFMKDKSKEFRPYLVGDGWGQASPMKHGLVPPILISTSR